MALAAQAAAIRWLMARNVKARQAVAGMDGHTPPERRSASAAVTAEQTIRLPTGRTLQLEARRRRGKQTCTMQPAGRGLARRRHCSRVRVIALGA